jgi:hypothetical protein
LQFDLMTSESRERPYSSGLSFCNRLAQSRLTAKRRSRGGGPSVVGPLLVGVPQSE